MRTSRILILAALAGAIAMTGPAKAAGRESRCDPAVQGALQQLQIDRADIGAISYQVRTHENSRGDTYVDRILAWVDLQSCTGKLVVELSPRCRVKQAYTTHSCTVPGLTAY